MDVFIAALEAALAEADELRGPEGNGATEILPAAVAAPPPRRERERERKRRRRVPWPLVALLLVALAGGAAVWALASGRVDPDVGNGGAAPAAEIRLQAVDDWDPEGDDVEHPEAVERATDGDRATYWTTETYTDFATTKPGVGLVLDAGRPVELGALLIVTDEPGFTARVQAGAAVDGPFEDVSDDQAIEGRTTIGVDTGGEAPRYYVLWITALEGRAIVNEVRAAD
jgi:hypothetical protein